MILGLFRKSTATEAVYAVYRAIVAQSRHPRFYAEWGVPDTVTGRFDMICLHLALLFRRLRSESKEVREFGQAVFDLFFQDMDRSLREMGAGDLAVPKKIRNMGNIFYGLLAGVSEAMDRDDAAALQAVLARNIFDAGAHISAAQLADYLFDEAGKLEAQQLQAIIAGRIELGASA